MIKKLPSFIDMHTHLRDFEQSNKETVKTGLMSAIKGGYGAVLAMANSKPVNDNTEITKELLNKAKDFENEIILYPVGAVTKGLNSLELTDFNELKKTGCIAFSNDGLPYTNKEIFKEALKTGELILSHLEDETNEAIWQIEAFKELIKEGFMPKLHFCHISKKTTLDCIKEAKKTLKGITAETCPHYFTFTKDMVDETGRYKMNPPLGNIEDKNAVIEAVIDGTIDIISTDHAPHLNKEKLLPYIKAPNGITGLETAFSLTYTQFGLDIALEKMAIAPRRILNINPKKEIEVDLDETWVVKGENLQSKCKITPYENMKLKGKIL